MNRFGPSSVVAPFRFQPSRYGLRGLGASSYSPPVGAGAGAGASIGASQGAAAGSYFGPIGTAVGAVVGAIGGAIAGSIDKKDPEQYNFDQAVALWQANRAAVLNIGDKYLVLAGLFDLNLNNPHIPIYLKYGHMGEQRFVSDMCSVIYQAAMNGQITAADTPETVMSRIVQPWIDSWGYGPMVDPHADMINLILLGMVAEYLGGQQGDWLARSGDFPFSSVPAFPIQRVLGAAAAPTTSASVNPVGSVASVSTGPSYSPNGSLITVSSPGTLQTPVGTFLVSGNTFAMNGNAVATAPTTAGIEYANGQVYRYDSNGATYLWNNGWQATSQAPTAAPMISSAISGNAINPVGSAVTVATSGPTPAQLVASPPAAGSSVAYAPDMSQAGTPMGLPSGLVYVGSDPYNGSWILQNTANGQDYVLWQGSLQPYTSSMFAPAAAATAAATTPVVTGSGSSGVYTGTAATPDMTAQAATAPSTTTSDNGLILALAIGGGILLASQNKPRRRRRG